MKTMRLNPEGISKFCEYLQRSRAGEKLVVPSDILADSKYVNAFDDSVEVDLLSFNSRLDIALYLNEKFSQSSKKDMSRDTGLWAWLSLFYFDVLCPADASGNRKIGEPARYIPEMHDYKRYYRHLLVGPYLILRAHNDAPDRAKAVLCQPVHLPGDIVEQLASRQDRITNKALLGVASRLYVEAATNKIKSGAGGKGPGSSRRLIDFLAQLDLTRDLYAVSVDELQALLPPEFHKFLKK